MFAHDSGGYSAKKGHFPGGRCAQSPIEHKGIADAEYECHLNSKGGYLLDTYTGEKVPIARKGNLYVMRAWVKDDDAGQGFPRQ